MGNYGHLYIEIQDEAGNNQGQFHGFPFNSKGKRVDSSVEFLSTFFSSGYYIKSEEFKPGKGYNYPQDESKILFEGTKEEIDAGVAALRAVKDHVNQQNDEYYGLPFTGSNHHNSGSVAIANLRALQAKLSAITNGERTISDEQIEDVKSWGADEQNNGFANPGTNTGEDWVPLDILFNPSAGGEGSDEIIGNSGDDDLSDDGPPLSPGESKSGDGYDTLEDFSDDGIPSADVLTGTGGDDSLRGLSLNDVLVGGGGNDFLDGGEGQNYIIGGSGMDYITNAYYALGGSGSDTINLSSIAGASAFGGSGNDTIRIGAINAVVNAGDGDDYVETPFAGGLTINLGDGNNSLSIANPYGFPGSTSDSNTISAGSGNNNILIQTGEFYTVNLGGGNNTVNSNVAYNITAGGGNNYFTGAAVNVSVGNGNNSVNSYSADGKPFTFNGGSGFNGVISYAPNHKISVGGEASIVVYGSGTINGGSGIQSVNVFGWRNQFISLGDDGDYVNSGQGDDFLDGGGGADTLSGSGGNDILVLDQDDITLGYFTGGAGYDSAFFSGDATGIDFLARGIENFGGLVGLTEEDDAFDTGTGILGNLYQMKSGNDVMGLKGSAATIDTGFGNDLVNAETRGNTYVFYQGHAADTINVSTATGTATDAIVMDGITLSGVAEYSAATDDWNLSVNEENFTIRKQASKFIITKGEDTEDSVTLEGVTSTESFGFSLASTGVSLVGGAQADTLTGESSNDTLDGAGGNDTLYGLAGDDSLLGGAGSDSLVGDTGNDTLVGGDSSSSDGLDTLLGGDGNDSLSGGYNHDSLYGDNGDDTLDGGLNNDLLNGGDGNDLLLGGNDNDTLIGGTGVDTFDGGRGNDVIAIESDDYRYVVGGGGSDSIIGSSLDDTLIGGDSSSSDGLDTLRGGGNDSLAGGYNHDSLYGDGGNDTLDGGLNNDLLDGGDGDDLLLGGNDTLIGGAGVDTFDGGLGNDVIAIESDDYRVVQGGGGSDSITGSALDDTLIGGDSSSADGLDTLRGGLGNDSLAGATTMTNSSVMKVMIR